MHFHGAHFHGVQTFKQTHLSKNKYICRKTVLRALAFSAAFGWPLKSQIQRSEILSLLVLCTGKGNIWSQVVNLSWLLLNGQESHKRRSSGFHPVMASSLVSLHLPSTGFKFILRIHKIILNKNHYFHSLSQKSFLRICFKTRLSVIKNTLMSFNTSLDFINLTYPGIKWHNLRATEEISPQQSSCAWNSIT